MNKILNTLIVVYIIAGIAACTVWGLTGDQTAAETETVAETETETTEVDNVRELVDSDTGKDGNDVGTASADAEEETEEADTSTKKETASKDDADDADDTDSETLTAEEEAELAKIEAQLDAYDEAARSEGEDEAEDTSEEETTETTATTSTAKSTTSTTKSSTATTSAAAATTEDGTADVQYVFTANTGVTLRSEPNSSSSALGTVKSGSSGVVLEVVDDYWCKVFVNNTEGYLCSQYITMTSLE